jgi:predicted transcriptional regulator
MGEHQIALHIDSDTKQRLEAEARWQHQSESEIAADAIKAYLDRQTHLRKTLEAAAIEADKGVFISSEAMMRWVKDLFDGKKTPPPRPDVFLPPRARS